MKRALTGALVLIACALTTSPTAAQTAAPSNTSAEQADILQLVSQTPVVEPDGDFTMRMHVTGAPAGAKLQAQVHDRVPTRSDFNASLDGKLLRRVLAPTIVVDATADASDVVVLTVPTRDVDSLLGQDSAHVRLTEGVYPVTVTLTSSTGSPLDTFITYLVRMPVSKQFGPLRVAVVVPLTAPPSLKPDGSVAVDPDVAQRTLSTASVLEAHATIPVTLDATPEVVDTADAATAGELRKASAGRQVPGAPYVDLDVGAWTAAGLDDGLGAELDRGTSTLRSKLGAVDTTTFVADGNLTTDAANELRYRGVRSFVVPEPALSPIDERLFNRTLTQPFELDRVGAARAVMADAGLARHAGETGDAVLDASHLLADLAVLYFDDPPDVRSAVIAFDATTRLDPRLLDALLTGLSPSVNRILRPITLSTLFTEVPPAGSRGETNGRGQPLVRSLVTVPSTRLAPFVPRIRDAHADVDAYRGMVTADNPRPDELERRILVAGAASLSDDERDSYIDGVRATVRDEVHKITPPDRQTITFTARDGVVSVTLRNTTGYPVQVRLALEGQKLEFPGHDDGIFDVTLAEETTRVSLNVRTRASGDSPLDITVSTPDDRITVGRTRITVRSTAFSGVGIILSVGSGVFLAVWWLRHAVETRRERRRRMRHAAR
jgi:hypothetical protein